MPMPCEFCGRSPECVVCGGRDDEEAEAQALHARFIWFRSKGSSPRMALQYARAEQFYDDHHWPYHHRNPEGEERLRNWLRITWVPDPLAYGKQLCSLCAWTGDKWEVLDQIGELTTQGDTDGARLIEADLLFYSTPTVTKG